MTASLFKKGLSENVIVGVVKRLKACFSRLDPTSQGHLKLIPR
ncbi:MAG TPA: hypothetical protein VN414_11170 [Methanosarcina sp.]|nr:hypothetical protein [Methanosarcina sp.]